MFKGKTRFVLRPDVLGLLLSSLLVLIGCVVYMFVTGDYMRYHFLFSAMGSAFLCIIIFLCRLPYYVTSLHVMPGELVWKRSVFSKEIRYPSPNITMIRICFGVHPFEFHHAKFSRSDWARANIVLAPVIAISHNKRGVALCCTFRKKLFLRLIECCPNAKVVACVRKNRPMPKRYKEFLEPYVSEVVADPLLKYDRKYPNKRDDQ